MSKNYVGGRKSLWNQWNYGLIFSNLCYYFFFVITDVCYMGGLSSLSPYSDEGKIVELNDPRGFPPDFGLFDGNVNLLVKNPPSPEIVKGLPMKKRYRFVGESLKRVHLCRGLTL